jgi:aminopeptidase N
MAEMARARALVAAVSLASALVGFPSPAGSVAGAASWVEAPSPVTTTPAIVPGSAGRSSLNLDTTYRATLKLTWATRAIWVDSTATIRNTSGGAIDRVELNSIAARLGRIRLRPVIVNGTPADATISDQTIVVPLGGVLPAGATTRIRVRFSARLRDDLAGSDWLFARANGIADVYRWLPWVSRRIAFDRPNHGDPFETPTSSSVRVTVVADRRLTLATTGDRVSVSPDGLTQVFEARDVRDFTVTAAADYATLSRRVGSTTVRAWFRPGTNGAALLDATADAFAKLQTRLGPYGYSSFDVVQSAGGFGMESPQLIWIPDGSSANLRYQVAHETAHQWFYGIVGNDQAIEPFTDEAAADYAARSVMGLHRASRCPTARLDLSIYRYSGSCYFETIYVQGGILLDQARRRIGSSLFWAAIRRYIADHRGGIATTRSLLQALDDATPLDLGATLFAARFPRLY